MNYRQSHRMIISSLWLQVGILTFVVGIRRAGLSGLPDQRGSSADPGPGGNRRRRPAVHRRRHHGRPAHLSEIRPDAARHDLRSRRVPGARFHRPVPAPRRPGDAGILQSGFKADARGPGPSETRVQAKRLRPGHRHAGLYGRPGPRLRQAQGVLRRVLRRTRPASGA